MTERWYCQINHQVKGPFEFEKLQFLVAEGTLRPADDVRTNREHVWRKAGSIPELFSQVADALDMSSMLEEELLDPSLERHREANEACYCRILGIELGPLSLAEIMQRARDGELSPDDDVRLGDDAEWIQAGTVVGLFKSGARLLPEDVSSRSSDDFGSDYGDFELTGTLSNSAPERETPGRDAPDGDTPVQIWYWQVAGREMGPFTFEEVVELARTGHLTRADKIRCGRVGEWMAAAAAVGGLFPKEQPHDVDDAGTDEPDDEFGYEDFVADAAAQQKAREARKAARRKPGAGRSRRSAARASTPSKEDTETPVRETPWTRSAAAERAAEPPVTRPEPATPPPAAVAPSPPPPRPAASAPWTRPAPAPPRPSRVRSGLDWDDLKEKAKYPAVAVVVLLIGFGVWHYGLPLMSQSFGGVSFSQNFGGGGGNYEDLMAIWSEARARHQPDFGSPEAWNEFKERSLPRINEIRDELEKKGASDDRSQILLRCCRDYLPKILDAGPAKTPKEWDEMRKSLETLQS